MRNTALISSGHGHHLYLSILPLGLFVFSFFIVETTQAQAPPLPITSSGLNTVVTTNDNVHNITGGTRPGNGPNLFHSFGEFNVPANNIANFLNETALPTSNILGRVTGNSPSSILGTIKTTDFSNANIFLMNPAGIIFGPNATLDVSGSVVFTTANSIRLFDGTNNASFYANPASDAVTTPGHVSILSAAPLVDFGFVTPAAFGFLDPTPASITVQGSGLSVDPGQSISFVGGDFTMTGGNLNARNGQVRIASVASTGEILHQDLRPAPNIKGDSFSGMGTINLSQGAVVNVSSNAAGIVKILGGQFVMTNATVSADTVNGAGAPVAIDINITGNMSIANDLAPALTAKSTGDGSAGAINITSANLKAITSPSNNLLALIDTHTSGMGTAGNITINTGDLHTINENFFIDSGSAGPGHGGDVTVSGTTIHIHGPEISTGNRRFGQLQGQEVTGSAGNLTISADSLKIEAANISTEAFLARAGDLTLEAGHIHITGNSFVSVDGNLGGATITVNADQLTIDTASQLNSNTVVKPGGNINITARIVDLSNGGFIQTSTLGDGPAGNIHITAMERVTLDDRGNTIPRPSGLLSNSFGDFGSLGSSGAIDVITPRLEIIGGAQMNSSTRSSGQAGTITITADSISILGERPFETPESFIELGSTRASGIYTRTVGSELCAGPCGNAGNVTVTTGSLNLESGGTINSGTINSGAGGNITIYATNAITMSGTMIDGTSSGIFSRTAGTAQDSGTGGNITLTAGQSVTISNGASVSASSNGPGNAGNISVNAGQQFEMRDSSITTQATKATGGNINIQAIDRVRLVNSPISTSVRSGPGSGGNITIDPNVVVLQNSPITAQADRGAGGNITITTPLFLADSTSPVSASSQFGRNGTVTIQSPTSNLSESLGTLPSEPSQAQTLLTQRCAALVNNGQTSSFVVAGREQLPADPGGWLTSPLAFAAWGESLDAGPAIAAIPTVMAIAAQGTGTVSIRRLTPAGFLMANFADSAATGCSS